MFDSLDTIRMARSLAAHAATRQQVVARNVANADTPGFKASDLRPFSETYETAEAQPMRATRATHYTEAGWIGVGDRVVEDKTAEASPNGNSVSIEDEMVKVADTKRNHDLAVSIYRSAIGLMRSSLGRRG